MKQTNATTIAILRERIRDIKEDMLGIKSKFSNYVTLDRFNPIEKIVWTLSLLALTSIVGAVIAQVYK